MYLPMVILDHATHRYSYNLTLQLQWFDHGRTICLVLSVHYGLKIGRCNSNCLITVAWSSGLSSIISIEGLEFESHLRWEALNPLNGLTWGDPD